MEQISKCTNNKENRILHLKCVSLYTGKFEPFLSQDKRNSMFLVEFI